MTMPQPAPQTSHTQAPDARGRAVCIIKRLGELTAEEIQAWHAMAAATWEFGSPLLSYEFAAAVERARLDVHVAIYSRHGAPIAFWAHHRRKGGIARPVGAPLADYCALISVPDPGLTGSGSLEMAQIREFRASGLIDPYGVFANTIHTAAEELETFAMDFRADAPAFDLPKKHLKNINRLRRHIEADIGPLRLVYPDRDLKHFEQMLALKQAQIRESGLHDFLAAPWIRRLLEDLFSGADDKFGGRMATLMAGDMPLVFHFGAHLGRRGHPWISSFDPAFFAYSPGQMFLKDLPEVLHAHGLDYYDLSTGQSHYKRTFTNAEGRVRRADFFARSEKPEQMTRPGLERLPQGWASRVISPIRRIGRRLDHIAQIELDTRGRILGGLQMILNVSKRLRAID